MYNSQDIAERIKAVAKSKGVSIKSMLSDCGLSKNSLSSMLSGGSTPKSENLAKIADYLQCSVDYLLGRTDIKEKQPDASSEDISEERKALHSVIDKIPPERRQEALTYLKYLLDSSDK